MFSDAKSAFCQSLALVLLCGLPLAAQTAIDPPSKRTMPNLRQVENTCFPYSAANLLWWFGENGYPKLLPIEEGSMEQQQDYLIKSLIVRCRTSYKGGTYFDEMADGLRSYLTYRGYNNARVEFRSLADSRAPTPEWMRTNAQPNRGFIICMMLALQRGRDFALAPVIGHAVTMVSYHDEYVVVHDPGYEKGGNGKKVLRFEEMKGSRLQGGSVTGPIVRIHGMRFPVGWRRDVVPLLVGAIMVEMPNLEGGTAAQVENQERPSTGAAWVWRMLFSN